MKIRIAKSIVKGETLLIEDCFRARDLQNSGNELDKRLPALKDFMEEHQDAAFGLDFPFGLPYLLVEQVGSGTAPITRLGSNQGNRLILQ